MSRAWDRNRIDVAADRNESIPLARQVSSTTLQSRIKLQLNTILFSKTLVKKDLASAAAKNTSLSAGESAAVTADLAVPDVGQTTGKKEPVASDEALMESEAVGGEKADMADDKKDEDDEDVTSKSQIMVGNTRTVIPLLLLMSVCRPCSRWTSTVWPTLSFIVSRLWP